MKRSRGGSSASGAQSCKCWAAMSSCAALKSWTIRRRSVGPQDVGITVLWTGVCHTDVHCARSEWGEEHFPMVPGHEITGVVCAVGDAVTKFKPGDAVGVADFVDSCRACSKCEEGREQFCRGAERRHMHW